MVGMRVRTRATPQRVIKKAQQGNIESLGHAGGAIRRAAIGSIRKSRTPSRPGQPPHTQTRRLPRAIKYAVEKQGQSVVIGTDIESIGTAGQAHEHGGRYRRERFPPRPFMRSALERLRDRLPRFWARSIN